MRLWRKPRDMACIKCGQSRLALYEAMSRGGHIPCSDDGGHLYGDNFVAWRYWETRAKAPAVPADNT